MVSGNCHTQLQVRAYRLEDIVSFEGVLVALLLPEPAESPAASLQSR